ncbi:MAG: hypothetical protein NTW37_21295 [Proteobacteria bacterium]|nr:hypothetical protein [Pseudomonadota bacterium]
MSAPPRSTVTLPRLAQSPSAAQIRFPVTLPRVTSSASASQARCEPSTTDRDTSPQALRPVPVGPGGGKLLSNALCVGHVELPTALCAYLHMTFASPRLTAPLGLARALVAIARQAGRADGPDASRRAARREFDRVIPLPEGALVQELAARLESIEWPKWVPRVAFVIPFGSDIATDQRKAPDAPKGVACPLLAARLVSAIRGPVFLRDAAPALSNLLDLWSGATPSGTWEIWLPVQPGQVQPFTTATRSKRKARS